MWGKIVKELIPQFIGWLKKQYRKKEIDKEVEDEHKEIVDAVNEANEYLKNNPDADKVPDEIEQKLRDAARKRRSGLV